MAHSTVETVQLRALPPGTQLVAGAAGLSRPVSWPATLRTRAPGFLSLKGGELLLIATASLQVLDPSLGLLGVLRGVERVGVAGVAVLGAVDAECRAYADRRELPVFVLPEGANLGEVEAAITRTIADSRGELHQRSHDLYRQLTQLAIEGRGLAAIIHELERVTGKLALFLDPSLVAQEVSRPVGDAMFHVQLAGLAGEVNAWTRATPIAAARAPVGVFRVAPGECALIAPVLVRAELSGFVAVVGGADSTDGIDQAAVAGAAAAMAIEVARQNAVLEAEERSQGGLLEELLAGSSPVGEGLRRRAARQSLDLEREQFVVTFAIGSDTSSADVLEAVQRVARQAYPGAVAGLVEGRVALIGQLPEDVRRASLENLRARLADRLGSPEVAGGVGRAHAGIEGLRRSHREAVDALRLGQQIYGPARVVFYADLGLDRLLLSFRGHPELDAFFRETMGKLAAYDARNDGELFRTLEAYFASHGSPTEAATRLHVHRNTLLYRLQRIRAVAGLDLDDPEVRLALQVALHIRRIRLAVGDT